MAQSKPKVAKPSVGIDLGTTYSCVAVFQNGRSEVIANSQGNRITPSVVAITKEGRLIGEGAEIQRKLDPPNAIYNAKRFIGRTWDDPSVQTNRSLYPFNVVQNNKKIQFQVESGTKTINLTPEEISAAILSKLKKIAEDYLEETVEDVVITVPAYFNDSQRQATVNAGKIAGLNVTRIINEPTAAAMAYGLREGTKENDGKNILVYDLGGGTFDVSVLQIEKDFIQVKATAGNSNLGGEDFNDVLVKHFKQEILRKYKFELSSNYKSIRRLTGACEQLKRNLSAENVKESKIELDNFLPDGRDFISNLTRAKFENLCKVRFGETIKCVEQALLDAHLTKEDIDEVVLVGGSSRIPKLQSMLSSFFNNKILNKSINLDEAVACGAAVQAAIINNDPHLTVKDLLLMDVIPLSIGINTGVSVDGIACIIVERNTAIPVRKTKTFETGSNNQSDCIFIITEGERAMTRDNRILGNFTINGLPPGRAGEVLFDVEMEFDENGILTVSSTVRGTNKKAGITLDPRSSGKLSDEEVRRLIIEAESMKIADQNEENRTLAMNKLNSLCEFISFLGQDFPDVDAGGVLKSVEECLSWISQHPSATEDDFISKYEELNNKAENVFNLSSLNGTHGRSSRSSHVLRMSKQTAKYFLKEGNFLLNSNILNDKIKAAEYFFKAYKTAIEEGRRWKEIEALVCLGHTHMILAGYDTEQKPKLDHALKAIKVLSLVMALEENKTLSDDERNAVIQDLQTVVERSFKIIENLKDNKKFKTLESLMSGLDKKRTDINSINSAFCQILFQSRVREMKILLAKTGVCLANEDDKEVQKYTKTLNYPKERAKLFAKTQEEKKQLAELIQCIETNMMQAEGLNQINLAVNILEDAKVDHPDTIDKALMALDHLTEAKRVTKDNHDQIFIKANFFEGKVFMDYFPNTSKAKSCFEKVITASEQKNFNTEEYRQAKDILEEIRQDQQIKEEKEEEIPKATREKVLHDLQQDVAKIKQADSSLSDQNFIDFLFTEYPPKHKENQEKPIITTDGTGTKKKAYLKLSMFYHPDKVDASEYGDKYKALCGEISKYVNGRL